MGGAIRNPKNPGMYFYSGLRKNFQGGGGAILNPKYNPGNIYFYSGFRKNGHGGCNSKS